jgi:ubiquinone/menaquinone biosynthesis C-methylase UbiE
MSTYAFQHNTDDEQARLGGLDYLWDITTIGVLDSLGISAGWRCLEAGAGSGTIARWTADRVGASGEITATDLDPGMLAAAAMPTVRVIRHDITTDPLPEARFDLVHARFLLSHLPNRREIVAALQRSCRPAGWVVVEDLDINSGFFIDMENPLVEPAHASELLGKMYRAMVKAMISFGFDPGYGREVAADMRASGLTDVSSVTTARLIHGGTPGTDFLRYSLLRLAGHLTAVGDLSKDEIDRLVKLFDDPRFVTIAAPLVSTWGRAARSAPPDLSN